MEVEYIGDLLEIIFEILICCFVDDDTKIGHRIIVFIVIMLVILTIYLVVKHKS